MFSQPMYITVINPQRACTARVTVVVVSVCVCVCVCLLIKSHLILEVSLRPENAVMYSVGNEGQKICGVFSDTVSFQRYCTCCIVRPQCSRPLSLWEIRACASKMLRWQWGGVWSVEPRRDYHQLSLRFSWRGRSVLVSCLSSSLHAISPWL